MTAREPPHCPTCHCGAPDPKDERIAKLERALEAWVRYHNWRENVTTHWEGCETSHLGCAARRLTDEARK